MREYFEAEMRLLREAGKEFAKTYPEQARMLNLEALRDRDPYIERLLEGMAFLTAQIRQKIDDDIPEISETLLLQLWPHLLRPFPSATIMEFNARLGQLQETTSIAKGMIVQSQNCKFRTSCAIKLNPLKISDVTILPAKTGGSLIKIYLQTDAGVMLNQLDLSALRLYIHADPALALNLHFALTGQAEQIRILFPEHPTQQSIILGKQECIAPCFLTAEDCLTPKVGRSFAGFHLLHEYFLFREKYFFVKIIGLEKILWPKDSQQLLIEIHSKLLLPDAQINKETLRLYCAPAINLFAAASEPIAITHRKYAYPIIVDADNMVYSVDNVYSTNKKTNERNTYQAMHSFNDNNYYHVIRRDNQVYLTLNSQNLNTEHVSCSITACNGHNPRRLLNENQINIPSAGFTHYIQFKNIIRPTPLYMPPQHDNYHWTLISHLSLNYNSLTNLENLQELLMNYDWTLNKENKKRIFGIYEINAQTINKIYKGALTQGIKLELKIHETEFDSLADIHLFGLILHHFFSMYAELNFFVITKIICYPSNKEFIWQPLLGANFPL
jgi:type VI secretion system protein ImpG